MMNSAAKPSERLFAFLAQARCTRPATVVFTFANPVTANEASGFGRRVKAVDGILALGLRVYVNFRNERRGAPLLIELGGGSFAIELADRDPVSTALLQTILDYDTNVYLHSVYPLQGETVRQVIRDRHCRCVLDLHGAVPEECLMQNAYVRAELFKDIERQFYLSADHVVCVSQNMIDHMRTKLGEARNPPILLPSWSEPRPGGLYTRGASERPTVIYAGGTEKWQEIPKMLDAIAATIDRFRFAIFTPEIAEIANGLRDRGVNPKHVALKSAHHDEVMAAYAYADLGFILRKDSIVNRVACPTKLVEYLACGVIPVMDCVHVGDFVGYGMQFVPLDDFEKGDVPSIEELRAMAQRNRAIYYRLADAFEHGKQSLAAALYSDYD